MRCILSVITRDRSIVIDPTENDYFRPKSESQKKTDVPPYKKCENGTKNKYSLK